MTCPDFLLQDAPMSERKRVIQIALANCEIVRDIGTDQMNAIEDPDLREDVQKMRCAALMAIPPAMAALRTDTLEDFNLHEREFRTLYDKVKGSVKSYLWDFSDSARDCLWPLADEVM
jgi:hypothetical protein